MADLSLDLRRRVVRAYKDGLTETYEATAELFSIGRATVSRLLRLERETGDVLPKKRGGDHRSSINLDWLRQHAAANPDARLVDRIDAWQEHSGRRVSIGAMWSALARINWTHKKRHPSRLSVTGRKSSSSDRTSSQHNPSSTSAG
jgi:transposase